MTIDGRLITNEVPRVWQGHHKGIKSIIKGKGKASATSYSNVSSGSQSQAFEEQHHLGERIDAQQCEIDTLKVMIAHLAVNQPQPQPPPKDAKESTRD